MNAVDLFIPDDGSDALVGDDIDARFGQDGFCLGAVFVVKGQLKAVGELLDDGNVIVPVFLALISEFRADGSLRR